MGSFCQILLLVAFCGNTFAQYYGNGGYNYYGGYGGPSCSQSLPNVMGDWCVALTAEQDPATAIMCFAIPSSVYQDPNHIGDYGPWNAVDGYLAPDNSGFFHSNYDTYPWLIIQFFDAAVSPPVAKEGSTDPGITHIDVYQRCDANELYHRTQFDAWYGEEHGKISTFNSPLLSGGKRFGVQNVQMYTSGTKFTISAANRMAVKTAKEVGIQKRTLHSHGRGWPNYNGNNMNRYSGNAPAQNSNVPAAFLMVNEIIFR